MQSGTEYGPSYQQQYAQYASQMQQVLPNNSNHDMSKQVQSHVMFANTNSGGIPGQQHHHQQGMGGPVPSPQPNPLVQQGQQISRQHMQQNMGVAAGFYQQRGPGGPRSMPNLQRNSLTNVVSQPAQQQQQQYPPLPMMSPHTTFHPSTAVLQMNVGPHMQQLYNRQYQQQQFPMQIQPQIQYVNQQQWNYSPQPQSTNGYFQPMPPSTYPPMTHQMPQLPAAQPAKAEKKIIQIIDPVTGKNILDDIKITGSSNSLPEKEVEPQDNSVGCQFAAQVAAAAIDGKREHVSKPSNNEDRISINSQQSEEICLNEVDIAEPIKEPDTTEMNDTRELYIEDTEIPSPNDSGVFYNEKEVELNNISDNLVYEAEQLQVDSQEPTPVLELENPIEYNSLTDSSIDYSDCVSVVKPPCVPSEELVPSPDSDRGDLDLARSYDASETVATQVPPQIAANTDLHFNVPEVAEFQPLISPVPIMAEEDQVSYRNGDVTEEISPPSISIMKSEEKPILELKKSKTKKKRDFSKRTDGGELDAFVVKEEVAETPASPSVPTAPPLPPEPAPITFEERLPSPIPILDTEILKTIPLPDEVLPPLQPNDVSPVEPLSESSLSPSAENEDKENNVEDATSKIVLKYSYKEDQWSPLNPEGKKQYDRNFLLHLQSQPMSMRKPSNLPNLDVIKDTAHIQRLTEVSMNRQIPAIVPQRSFDPFMPVYARQGGGGPIRPPNPLMGRRSQQGRDKPKKVIAFSCSLNQAVKLHESENAWKPGYKAAVTAEEETEIQELHRKVRGILNKLTPQKFSTLVEQVKNLEINTEERLNSVIDLVFEKAIDEPNFSVPYANMCKQLAKIQVPLAGQAGQCVNFRKLLLTKCQKEFEQDRCDELKREEQLKAIETAENEEKRKILQFEFDQEEKKTRYRQLGNIRFIGELFKLGMLIEPIMHECIKKLLHQGDEESLECLCRLLKTIGKELDEGKKGQRDNNVMELCFNEMQKFVDKRLTSSRVRFMLQDVIDLKKGGWIPRRDENNPKTIDQIHKDAEREAQEQQVNFQNVSFNKRNMPDDRDRRKGNAGRNMGVSEDGWTPTKSNKGGYGVVDPLKLRLTKPAEVESMHLGPGGRGLSSWAKGSSGGNKSSFGEQEQRSMLTNRYSALAACEQPAQQGYDGRRGAQRSAASSRESSRGRSNQMPQQVRKTPSITKDKENLLESVKLLTRGTMEQKTPEVKKPLPETHVNGKDTSVVALKGVELTEEEIEKKIKPLIDEFVHNGDTAEAIKCIMELASPATVHMFVSGAVNQVLERSSQARCLLGQLLYSMLQKTLINLVQFEKGFKSVLEFIDDYALDIPLIWDYLGEILEAMQDDQNFSLSVIRDVLKPIMPSVNAGKLMCAVLHCAAKKRGSLKVGDEWRENGLEWAEFLSSDIISDFIKTNKLEFTISQTKVQPKIETNIGEIKESIEFLLKKSDENKEVFDWIEANVAGDRLAEPAFIRALVAVVHEDAITGSEGNCELDAKKLKKRGPLLMRYIDHNDNLELQALYAVQALVNQLHQPKNILRGIFDILYDDDVIGEEAFKTWQTSKDPAEQEGKGVALLSVGPFFTWLREADEESADADDETD